jgi:hypothetical protein
MQLKAFNWVQWVILPGIIYRNPWRELEMERTNNTREVANRLAMQ